MHMQWELGSPPLGDTEVGIGPAFPGIPQGLWKKY
jgi:hypothetical protein